MSYPRRVARLRPTKGFAFDVPANEVADDYYTGGSNVLFRDGFPQRIGGSRSAYTQNNVNPVYHLLNVRAPGGVTASNFWLVAGTSSVKALETTNITDITGAALSAVSSPWEWASTLLNNIPCFTNGRNAPRYWGGNVGVPLADLPGWPAATICKSLMAFRFHLFALDIDGPGGHFESQILWSSAAAPGNVPATWTAAATNEAGSATLSDTPGPCMIGIPLRQTLIVFKRSGMYAVDYVGGNSVFSVRLLDGVRGALTRHAAVDIGGRILVVADGDVGITDGTNWQSIAQGRVRNYLFGQLDQTNYENLYVVYHRAKNEAWICYPTAGNTYATEAIVYNVGTDEFGLRSLTAGTCAAVGVVNDLGVSEAWDSDGNAWDTDNSAWNSANFSLAVEQILTAANSATITLQDDNAAVAVDATLYKHDMPLGDPERTKFVRRVHVRTNAVPGDLFVRVGVRNSVTDAIAWGAEQTLTAPNGFVNVRALGKFVSVGVRSAATQVWQVTGLDLEHEIRGYR